MDKLRCAWVREDRRMIDYHDREWGVPLHRDQRLFEFLVLEGMQAGLSWSTILNKRASFRKAFSRFNPVAVACFTERDTRRLLGDPGIIRNRLKIEAAINNAQRFLEVKKEFGSFDRYIWQFVDGKPIRNERKSVSEIPASSELSDAISRDLKQRGFKFVGTTIIYAHMQATGMVNDHTVDCFRYQEL